jgi:hypothetical protein
MPHNVPVRFEVTRALDAVERRLSTDPVRTGGIVDLSESIRRGDLDGGQPVSLLRLGLFVDGLAMLLGDGAAALYPVAERGLLSDTDLTSNERIVLRRWSDDGLLELLPAGADVLSRAGEIGALTGQPVLTRARLAGYALRPTRTDSGVALIPTGPGPGPDPNHPVLTRMWRCPVLDCPSFGRPGNGQPPPHLATGDPVCPRHAQALTDAGPRPPVVVLVARVNGLVCHRFAVAAGSPVVVGRAPDERNGVMLGPHLDDAAGAWVSRRHLSVELRGDGLYATDMSTNGTTVHGPGGHVDLRPGQPYRLGEGEVLELFDGVEVTRASTASPRGDAPGSVLGEAPTVAIRRPRLG